MSNSCSMKNPCSEHRSRRGTGWSDNHDILPPPSYRVGPRAHFVKTALTAPFFTETGADSSGCMVMQPGKIYQARFRWFCGSPATTFARQTPETSPVPIGWCRQRMLCLIRVTGWYKKSPGGLSMVQKVSKLDSIAGGSTYSSREFSGKCSVLSSFLSNH